MRVVTTRPKRKRVRLWKSIRALFSRTTISALALQLKGRLKEAIPEFQKAVDLNHDPYSIAMLAQAYARNGQTDEARKLLDAAE